MTEDRQVLQELLVARMVRFSAAVYGTVTGLVFGSGIFIATIWLIVKGGAVVGPHLGLLGQFFIGYRVSVAGAVIGFAWGFAVGFALGYFTTSIYNGIVSFRERRVQGDR